MRPALPFQPIVTLIQEHTVVTFSQIKEVIGPVSDLTVRKKNDLSRLHVQLFPSRSLLYH